MMEIVFTVCSNEIWRKLNLLAVEVIETSMRLTKFTRTGDSVNLFFSQAMAK
jgi:hypothetical protein